MTIKELINQDFRGFNVRRGKRGGAFFLAIILSIALLAILYSCLARSPQPIDAAQFICA
jgi:hypothetical protein